MHLIHILIKITGYTTLLVLVMQMTSARTELGTASPINNSWDQISILTIRTLLVALLSFCDP